MFGRATIRLGIGAHSSLFGSVRQIKLAIRQLLGAGKYTIVYRIVSYRIVQRKTELEVCLRLTRTVVTTSRTGR